MYENALYSAFLVDSRYQLQFNRWRQMRLRQQTYMIYTFAKPADSSFIELSMIDEVYFSFVVSSIAFDVG